MAGTHFSDSAPAALFSAVPSIGIGCISTRGSLVPVDTAIIEKANLVCRTVKRQQGLQDKVASLHHDKQAFGKSFAVRNANVGEGTESWRNRVWQARPGTLQLVMFYVAYVLAGGFSQGLAIIPGISIVFWPPAGIFAATLLLTRPQTWPWWIVIGYLAELTCNAVWFHNAISFALIYYIANALTAITAASLITRFTDKPYRFESPKDVAALIVLGSGVAPLVSATMIAATVAWLGKTAFWTAWPLVWLGDGSGLLVSMPLTLLAIQVWRDKTKIKMAHLIPAVGLGVALLAIAVLAYQGTLPTVYLMIPVLLWIAARYQFKGTAVALAAVTLVAAFFTTGRTGIFAGDPALLFQKMVGLQAFLAVSAILGLVVATLSHQHQSVKADLRFTSITPEISKESTVLLSRICGLLVTVLGVFVLVGWAFGLDAVKSAGTGLATLKVNTALCFIALGVALAYLSRTKTGAHPNALATGAALFALAISLATLAEYAFGVSSGLDQILFLDDASTLDPGRMPPATAGAFFAASLALLMPRLSADHFNAQSLLWGLVLTVAAAALAGYAIDVKALYQIGVYNSMALHTATGFAVLAMGGLALSWPRKQIAELLAVGAVGDGASRYFFAAVLVLFAAWLRFVLGGLTGLSLSYVTFYPAVMLVALLAGWRAGIFATIFSALTASYYFVTPLGFFSLSSGDFTGLVFFALTGFAVSYLADQWVKLYDRTVAERDHLDRLVDERTTALRQTNRQLRLALSAAKMTAWHFAPGSGVVTLTDNAADALDLPSLGTIRKADDGDALIHPDDRENHRAKVDGALAAKGSYVNQYRLVHDGKVIWAEEHAHTVIDPDTQLTELVGITANISARKQIEEALRASEELNRSTLQALPAHIAVIDGAGRIVAVNQAWSEFAVNNAAEGCAISTVGTSYLDVCRRSFAEDGEAAQALAGIEAVLAGTARQFAMEYACHGPLEQRWFLMIAAPFHSDSQRGAVISHLNITDRKQAEIAMRTSEKFSRSVLEASPDCVKVMTAEGRIEFMNGNGRTQLEVDDADFCIGAQWSSFWPEETRKTVENALDAARNGAETHFEAFCPTLKGTPKWWDVAVSPVFDTDSHCHRIISVSRDISARKWTEEALKTSLERLETAEYATNALNYDTRGSAVWRGPGLTRVLGWQQEEVPATVDGWLSLVHPDDLPQAKAVEVMPSNDGESRFAHEYRARHKDGHYVWLMDRGSKERDAAGNVTGIVGASFDITSRKQTEEALRKSERSLTAVFDALPLGVALIDPNGMPLIANEVFKRYVPEIIPSRDEKRYHLWEAYDGEGRRIEQRDYPGARALRGERVWPGQEVLFHGDFQRGPMWARVAALPIRDEAGEIVGATAVISDIDQEKRASDGLRDSEARFTRASELARFGAYTFDVAARRGTWSPSFWSMMGRENVSEISLETFLEFVHPDDRRRVSDAVYAVISRIGPYEAEYRLTGDDGAEIWVMDRGEATGPLDQKTGLAARTSGMVLDISERKRNEQHQTLLMNELNHRVKNTLATVQSMASQTLRTSPSLSEAKTRFEARLLSLSKAHDVLTREKWDSAPLADIVERAIFPYRGSTRHQFVLGGPDIRVPPQMALAFSMTLHELCTNAVKYGALSKDTGSVEIVWSLSGRVKSKPVLKLRWREKGGPPVKPPATRGFGTKLIERSLASDLGGDVKMTFAKKGFTCLITTLLENPVGNSQPKLRLKK